MHVITLGNGLQMINLLPNKAIHKHKTCWVQILSPIGHNNKKNNSLKSQNVSIPTLPQCIQYEHKWIILHKELWAKLVSKDGTLTN